MTEPARPRPEPLPQVRPSRTPAAPSRNVLRDNAIVGWARAIALGIQDTAHDMLDEGRKAAREAQAERWRRYDEKTKKRPKE